MITVGYGDITPATNYEKVFIIFITIITCGVFAYSVNTIGSIFREITLKEAAFQYFLIIIIFEILIKKLFINFNFLFKLNRKKRFDITNYMMIRKISKNMQIKVIKALEYAH